MLRPVSVKDGKDSGPETKIHPAGPVRLSLTSTRT